MTVEHLTGYLDDFLRSSEVNDYPNALNGLQVYRTGEVRRVALAVDASLASISEAARRAADLLIVHHGLFWDGLQPVTGRRYRRLSALLGANLGLYSSHLPLDMHPLVGNNAVLAREIGLSIEGRFGDYKGTAIGVWGTLDMRREALTARLDQVLGGHVRMVPGGPEKVRRVGLITGGAGDSVEVARKAGLDSFITGEGAHHNYFDAAEGGVNLFLGGHYATEVWGIKALATHLEKHFGLECFFIDNPTGL
jgi:dinuclear metal center YbgI/SA1388 family protein